MNYAASRSATTIMYTEDQLDQYFEHIAYPRSRHAKDPLTLLHELQEHHLARVPFESITLHYSHHRLLSLDLQDLFEKIVRNSRGGYCMEVNALFGAVLQSLGFTLINAGGRVKGDSRFTGWGHMVNLVTVDGQTFLVDVGFGSNGPVHPILLESGSIISNIAPRRARLDFKKLVQHTNPGQRAWVYSSQENPDAEWKEMYSFVEIEFFPEDFAVMNLSTMSRPQSYFVKTVLAMRTLMNAETGETEGVMILHGDYIKRRIGDQSEILERLESEEQRVQALAKYFQIFLKPEEQKAIRGLATELKSTPGP